MAKQRGRPKGPDNKSASFRLPTELLELLAKEASTQDRTQTTLVRRALEAYLKNSNDE